MVCRKGRVCGEVISCRYVLFVDKLLDVGGPVFSHNLVYSVYGDILMFELKFEQNDLSPKFDQVGWLEWDDGILDVCSVFHQSITIQRENFLNILKGGSIY